MNLIEVGTAVLCVGVCNDKQSSNQRHNLRIKEIIISIIAVVIIIIIIIIIIIVVIIIIIIIPRPRRPSG